MTTLTGCAAAQLARLACRKLSDYLEGNAGARSAPGSGRMGQDALIPAARRGAAERQRAWRAMPPPPAAAASELTWERAK